MIERLVTQAAVDLKVDSAELRRLNFIPVGEFLQDPERRDLRGRLSPGAWRRRRAPPMERFEKRRAEGSSAGAPLA